MTEGWMFVARMLSVFRDLSRDSSESSITRNGERQTGKEQQLKHTWVGEFTTAMQLAVDDTERSLQSVTVQ
jgi:hypothetical protein